jgi:hypothetical protein
MDGRWEWLAVTLAGTTLYLADRLLPGFPLQAWAYGTAAIVITTGACLRAGLLRGIPQRLGIHRSSGDGRIGV